MFHQYGRLGRSLMNGGRAYCSILELPESPRPWAGSGFSRLHNALCGADEFARCALHAAASSVSIHSLASALRRWSLGCRVYSLLILNTRVMTNAMLADESS